MINLKYRRTTDDTMTDLGTFNTLEEANRALVDYYTSRGFKSYYWRSCQPEPGLIVVDFGSWSEFGYFYNIE